MRANARSKLKWKYDGKGSQTATWENYGFAVWLDMKDIEGKRWHLTTWETGREALTKTMIFKGDTLAPVYQHAERLVCELEQFRDISQVREVTDKNSLDLRMHIFEGVPPEFRTGEEVIQSIREASDTLRRAADWIISAPISKDKLPIVATVARSLESTAGDVDSRLADIEWSING